jgi:hypothetical protein
MDAYSSPPNSNFRGRREGHEVWTFRIPKFEFRIFLRALRDLRGKDCLSFFACCSAALGRIVVVVKITGKFATLGPLKFAAGYTFP